MIRNRSLSSLGYLYESVGVIKLKSANYILKKLRCDNGGENFKALTELCEKHGLAIEITAPYTPQQNGIVERKFATIRDRSSAAMIKAKFSEEAQGTLWAEAANTHTRLTNIVSNSLQWLKMF